MKILSILPFPKMQCKIVFSIANYIMRSAHKTISIQAYIQHFAQFQSCRITGRNNDLTRQDLVLWCCCWFLLLNWKLRTHPKDCYYQTGSDWNGIWRSVFPLLFVCKPSLFLEALSPACTSWFHKFHSCSNITIWLLKIFALATGS